MSVQAGIWWFEERPVSRQDLRQITCGAVEPYWDCENAIYDSNPGLIFAAFHATPESRGEQQPYRFGNGNLITWDGRLDNRDELLRALGSPLKELKERATDLAIATAAFERWGLECFRKFVGDWAASIWLAPERKLIVARDYAGVKHLFYTLSNKGVKWCTFLAPLALSGPSLQLNDAYFAGFLTMWPPANITPYSEINFVPPGACVVITPNGQKTFTFWKFNPSTKIRYKSESEYEEHFRLLFRQAVRRRLRTDSPILAELSGGLDSSSIVCMADDVLSKEGAAAPGLDTFSCYDLDEPDEDDIRYFHAVEKRRGRSGHHAELKGVGDTLALKFSSFSAVPGFGAREELKGIRSDLITRREYRIVLSGVGGDEMLGQTLDPRVVLAGTLRELRVKQLVHQLIEWSLYSRRPLVELLFAALLINLPRTVRRLFEGDSRVPQWINPGFARRYALKNSRLQAAQGPWFWPPTIRDALQTLEALRRQMSMASPAHFETRYPYLDQNLVEFLMSIPVGQVLRPGETRSLMRRALSAFLPPEIATRRTKSGMGKCIIITMTKHWTEVESAFREPLLERVGYVNGSEVLEALREIRDGTLSPQFFLTLRALSAELWLKDAVARGVVAIDARSAARHMAERTSAAA